MEIGNFKIPGHSTKRQWAVYLFVATPKNKTELIKIYVGKVGDNRDGCNPVISRVGNHFSHNKIHSQIRNKIENTEEYDYEYFYCHFGEYEDNSEMRIESRNKINELERELNRITQNKISTNSKYELLNPYVGKYVSKAEKKQRTDLLELKERKLLDELAEKALLPINRTVSGL